MITSWDIYWITRLDAATNIYFAIGTIGVVTLVAGLIWLILEVVDNSNFEKKAFALLTSGVMLVVSMVTISALTPTTKEAVAIWTVPKIVNNEQVQQIPNNFAKLINDKLKDWMKDVDILQERTMVKNEKNN